MGWLFKKKDDVLDLTERYKKQQERLATVKKESESSSNTSASTGGFGIFGMQTPTPSPSGYVDVSTEESEKKRKLAKRLLDITDRLEELSNQIYHLQQRIELLEKKSDSGY